MTNPVAIILVNKSPINSKICEFNARQSVKGHCFRLFDLIDGNKPCLQGKIPNTFIRSLITHKICAHSPGLFILYGIILQIDFKPFPCFRERNFKVTNKLQILCRAFKMLASKKFCFRKVHYGFSGRGFIAASFRLIRSHSLMDSV